MNDSQLTVLLHCTNLPGVVFAERQHLRLGIQKDKEVIEDVPADSEEVTFTFSIRAIRKAEWDFAGPFVHGKLGDRFLYLCWGERLAGHWDGCGRAKIKLSVLDARLIERALKTGTPLVASLLLTDPKGRPACASLNENYVHWSVSESTTP